MTEAKIWTFFYGSFMNPDVLKKLSIVPDEFEVATLSGFDISIRPLANLAPSPDHCVYGVAATTTHAELARLYDYACDTLGGTYLPQAVLVQLRNGKWLPAMSYVASELKARPAANDYVDLIVHSAKHYAFPKWYIDRLESFRP